MTERVSPNWSFWLIALVALIWNAMGTMNFLMQFSADSISGFPEKYQAIILARPVWATAGFGIGAVLSVVGSLGLLVRRGWAVEIFIVSMIGLIVALVDAAPKQIASGQFSFGELAMTVALPVVVSVFLVRYAAGARSRSWIV